MQLWQGATTIFAPVRADLLRLDAAGLQALLPVAAHRQLPAAAAAAEVLGAVGRHLDEVGQAAPQDGALGLDDAAVAHGVAGIVQRDPLR